MVNVKQTAFMEHKCLQIPKVASIIKQRQGHEVKN
jgi:hypothetical protein